MNNKMMFLAPGMVLGAVVIAAPIPNVKDASVDKTVQLAHVGREKVKFDSTKLVKLANTQVDNEDFDGAIKTYSEAVKLLSKYASGTAFSSQLEYCQKQIKRCYLQRELYFYMFGKIFINSVAPIFNNNNARHITIVLQF